jgi:rubredoxin
MIFLWLKSALLALLRLLIPPPKRGQSRVIDVNAECPACGHRQGAIKFLRVVETKPLVRHQCAVCEFGWYEEPVQSPEMPAV